jgi:hypothetical protein
MNWSYYSTLLDHKIADAQYNYDYAEKKAREAKAVLNAVLLEKENFEKALKEMVDKQ